MFCSRCGKEVAATSAFCGACGAPTATGPEPPAVKQGRSPLAIVITVIVVVIGGIMLLGIVAAIVVPGFSRARQEGNEAAALASMRTIVSAQVSYSASAGKGYFATRLATLARPCPGTTQGFIPADLAQDPSTKSGYTIRLESAGTKAGPPDCNGVATEENYYATATPVTFEDTGRRAFSTSASGALFEASGLPPTVEQTLEGRATVVR